ncbi:MAG: formimidoylglutamase [Bacteroidetes bacterium]|nr:formimidoylglutamase [Bacteroidota bacterium]
MNDIQHFFSPLDLDIVEINNHKESGTLSSLIFAYRNGFDFPEIDGIDIAVIGVCEDRGSSENKGSSIAPNEVRKYLYNLFEGDFKCKIADLGNILAGNTIKDSYFALSEVIECLIRKNVIPLIIGGSHDLTYAQFLGYKNLEQTINMVCVDSLLDIGNPSENPEENTYLGKIILHQPNFLFNYSNIGYQTYLVNKQHIETMQRLYFDCYRLGEIRDKIEEAEPIIRQADMLSFDFSSIKHSDAPANSNAMPNGFYAEEACQMMRYAGMNDRLSSIGLYEINPNFDENGKTAHLAAQMIWCFIEGFYHRKNDIPNRTSPDYKRFHVMLSDEKYEINFYKSNKSDRWWMEIPYPPQKGLKFERHTLIPCSYKDYEMAINNEVPDRWWQTYQKLF